MDSTTMEEVGGAKATGPASDSTTRASAGERPGGHDRHDASKSNGHLASIYKGQAEQFASVIPFIKQGLAQGERCLYVADDNTAEEIQAALGRGGIDVDAAIANGSLSIRTAVETYLKEGEFRTGKMLRFWQETLAEAKDDGYAGLRAAAEMTWALGDGALDEDGGMDRLVEYEAMLNSLFTGEDYVILCQYSRRRFPEDILSDVIRSHPLVVCKDAVCKNSYYQRPPEFLSGRRVSLDVDRAIEELASRSLTHVERQKGNEQLRKERLRRWARQQEVIAQLGRLGLEERDLDRLFSEVAKRSAEALGADCCSVLEIRSDAQELCLLEAAGSDGKVRDTTVGNSDVDVRNGTLAASALQAGGPVVEQDLEACVQHSPSSDHSAPEGASGVGAIVGPPGNPWGVLVAYTCGQRMLSEQDAAFLQSIANTVASAVERVEQERYQRKFHELTTGSDLSFEEKVERLLDLGCERFGLDVGFLTQKEGTTFKIVAARGAPDVVEPGVTVVEPRPDQYCRKTVTLDDAIWVEDAEAVGWDDDPLYREYGLECYLGVKVTVGDRVYGTFCFAGDKAQKKQITEAERTFLDLMGQWVEYELNKKRREEDLKELNETLEERVEERTRQVRDLTTKVTLAEQRERDRIARLLHDGLQQRLYGSQLQISSLRRDVQEADPVGLAGRVQKIEGEIEEVRQALRRLSVGMSPPVLEGDGLKGVLEWLQSHMSDAHGLELDLTAEREFRVEEEMRVLLFRVTKELLVTLADSAEASKATIEVNEEAKDFVIEVAVEGRGLDLETIESQESEDGIGLTVACERLRLFGGEMTLKERPDTGTHAEIRVPLEERGTEEPQHRRLNASGPDI